MIGGGGHSKIILDILALQYIRPEYYIDDVDKPQLNEMGLRRITADTLPAQAQGTISFGGITTEMLSKRMNIQQQLKARGMVFPPLAHPRAIISSGAIIHEGAQICAGAIINAGAQIGAGSIINSGAIIEHDVAIGEGCHIAPGAIVLGDAKVGEGSFIGSAAVIVQGCHVTAHSFVRAMSCASSS